MNPYTELLDHIEHRIAVDGIHGLDDDLTLVADILVRTGALPTVAGVLADPGEPEVARLRALARASRALRSMRAPAMAVA